MDTLTITLKERPAIIDAYCGTYAYQPEVPNPDHDPEDPNSTATISNPETAEAFTVRHIKAHISNVVGSHLGAIYEVEL